MYFPKPLQHDGHVPKEVAPMPLGSVALPCGIYRPSGGDKEFVLSCQGLATTPVPLCLTLCNEWPPLSLTRSLTLHRVCRGRRIVCDGQQWEYGQSIFAVLDNKLCWKLGYSSSFSTNKAPYNHRWWALTQLDYELKYFIGVLHAMDVSIPVSPNALAIYIYLFELFEQWWAHKPVPGLLAFWRGSTHECIKVQCSRVVTIQWTSVGYCNIYGVTVWGHGLIFSVVHLPPLTIDSPFTFTVLVIFFADTFRYIVW